jgi:lipopolysaccharide export system permease protein
MARQGSWTIWFGKGLSPAVLIPTAIFITYKANNDSTVFNFDVYKEAFRKMFGLRLKRATITSKEVIINDPAYVQDAENLRLMNTQIENYARVHNLKSPPNVIKAFFKYQPDHEIEELSKELETVIEDLSNTRDKYILSYINRYPILSVKAHTRPFERRWKNVIAAIIIPAGLFFYCRMWRFRLRLDHDLRVVYKTNESVIERIGQMTGKLR